MSDIFTQMFVCLLLVYACECGCVRCQCVDSMSSVWKVKNSGNQVDSLGRRDCSTSAPKMKLMGILFGCATHGIKIETYKSILCSLLFCSVSRNKNMHLSNSNNIRIFHSGQMATEQWLCSFSSLTSRPSHQIFQARFYCCQGNYFSFLLQVKRINTIA